MAKEKQPGQTCEAPFHVNGCNGFGETRDHFTPRCIAKLLGWKQKQIGDPMNIQYLSIACHNEKDSTTPARLQIAKEMKNGREFIPKEYMLYFAKLTKTEVDTSIVFP